MVVLISVAVTSVFADSSCVALENRVLLFFVPEWIN